MIGQVHLLAMAGSLSETEALLRAALADLGVTAFNYGAAQMKITEGPVIDRFWTNMEERWIQRYVVKRYHLLDRLVAAALVRVRPFTFSEIFSVPPDLPEQEEMETEFPYRNGVVVPIHSPFGRFGMLSAACDHPILDGGDAATSFIANVALLATTAHERAEQLSAVETASSIALTDREVECLRWSVFGKTSDEIAVILGLTERTVRKHITTAMDKLNVTNRVQAVSKALALGLVSFGYSTKMEPDPRFQ
ncbi:helix-turn-helix transcriptional regulator [Pseudorhizobium flavum]|uniref:DNA-binding CsgD family transcriptional regulator n=1 Tax=Pseudorhizobium flavum TaxID=1335061 RepID=A0A7W9Z186_9HYPH|nr:LuxR family transcriptional regulator [Pseudorhizobium flavum]MBB6182062.1 DNA-binding CsgD family transcriptional regulator [Pseudorhizobium flavum]CAD6632147.1 LuxR family transcriptional regulator [Pseudorhizobium flavum]